MNDETEEKSLPASEKKLRDARRKGQVPHSRDLITGFTLTCLFIYLLFAGPGLVDRLIALVNISSQLVDRPFAEAAGRATELALDVLLLTALPFVAIVVAGDLVSGMASTFGPVFSFELVKPQFDHINPAKGLKRLFSVRNAVEFAKAAVKVAILSSAFFLIMRGAIGALFETPACGEPCLIAAAIQTVKPLVATAIACFLAIGLLDLLLQRRMFLRDMRMTRTEHKRENKELQGDPIIRKERRRLRRQSATRGKPRIGMEHAVVAIMHGDLVVGLRFRPGETPVPIVVCKGDGEAGVAMLAEARQRGIAVVDDAAFVTALATRHRVGDFIATDLFPMAAKALVAARSFS
jgi:type III secretion protein U